MVSIETTLSTALSYVSLGYKVFPVSTRGKYPLAQRKTNKSGDAVPGGFYQASASRYQLEWWFGKSDQVLKHLESDDLSIALVNDNLLIVDIDRHDEKADGIITINQLEEELGRLPNAPTVITPSGGFHVFYKRPPFMNQKIINIRESIDVLIGSEGTFAPSDQAEYLINECNSSSYYWIKKRPLVPADELPELPERWIEWLKMHAQQPEALPQAVNNPHSFQTSYPQSGSVSLSDRIDNCRWWIDNRSPEAVESKHYSISVIGKVVNVIFTGYELRGSEGRELLGYWNSIKVRNKWTDKELNGFWNRARPKGQTSGFMLKYCKKGV